MEEVILVDRKDNVVGYMEKQEAHIKGLLHRAFSVFIFNNKNELLLQRRADSKYHSGGLWTNTCCSHPRKNELNIDAANRRLEEEMGMKCAINKVFTFTYRAELEQGLIENEYDHVFFGRTNDLPVINKEEVSAFKYINLNVLENEISNSPQKFTKWLLVCFPKIKKIINE